MTDRTTKCFRNETWCRNDALFKQGQRFTGRRTINWPSNKNISINLSPITQFQPWTVKLKLILFLYCLHLYFCGVEHRYCSCVSQNMALTNILAMQKNLCGSNFPPLRTNEGGRGLKSDTYTAMNVLISGIGSGCLRKKNQ